LAVTGAGQLDLRVGRVLIQAVDHDAVDAAPHGLKHPESKGVYWRLRRRLGQRPLDRVAFVRSHRHRQFAAPGLFVQQHHPVSQIHGAADEVADPDRDQFAFPHQFVPPLGHQGRSMSARRSRRRPAKSLPLTVLMETPAISAISA
jgi:hypothetical protein